MDKGKRRGRQAVKELEISEMGKKNPWGEVLDTGVTMNDGTVVKKLSLPGNELTVSFSDKETSGENTWPPKETQRKKKGTLFSCEAAKETLEKE